MRTVAYFCLYWRNKWSFQFLQCKQLVFLPTSIALRNCFSLCVSRNDDKFFFLRTNSDVRPQRPARPVA